MSLPWLEKHRPKEFSDICGNKATVERLAAFATSGNMPNLLFCGAAGIGKTTSMLVLAKKLLGDKTNGALLELNASNERGIDVVRGKIKTFAQTQVTLPPGRHKIVILDEADSITPSAQNALRRTMEVFSSTTRFMLACNISDKIIEALQSRCAVLRFAKLEESAVLRRMLRILELEHVKSYTNEGLQAIISLSDGDLRNAINSMQVTLAGFQSITADNVYKVCDVPHPQILLKVLELCSDFKPAEALNKINGLFDKGYMANDIVSSLFRVAKSYDRANIEMIKEIGMAQMRVLGGNSSQLQLNGLVAKLCRVATAA